MTDLRPNDGRRLALFLLWSAGVTAAFLARHSDYLIAKFVSRWAQM